jgi:hypothetical protein
MGHSLAPFFRRLANLAPADRAFAVHLGQLSPTAARLADARQAPVLPRYAAPSRPPQVAQTQPQPARPTVTNPQRDRRSRRERERDARNVAPLARATAPAQTPPVQTAAAAPLPGPPVMAREQTPLVQPLPKPRAEEIDAPVRSSAPVEVARRETPPPERSAITAPGQGGPAAVSVGDTARAEPTPSTAVPPATNVAAAPLQLPTETLSEAARPAQQTASAATAPKPEPTPPGPARVGQEDNVLASIVAGITIPGEELQIVNVAPVDPIPAPAPEPVRPEPKPVVKPAPKPETVKPAAKPKPEPVKPDAKAKKPDPKAKKPEPKPKVEPARIWVQVAGGANEASLPKAWKAVVAKAPAAFRGKSGWSTPLRATNRVLAGPFKTTAEAQNFVNALRKADVSGFVFTSEAGQKVTKLGAE